MSHARYNEPWLKCVVCGLSQPQADLRPCGDFVRCQDEPRCIAWKNGEPSPVAWVPVPKREA